MDLAGRIREKALEIGFDRIGFASTEPFDLLARELEGRDEMYNWVSENLLCLKNSIDPLKVMPSGKTIIVLLWDYYKQAFPEKFNQKVGKAYQVGPYSRQSKPVAMIKMFRRFLKEEGLEVTMGTNLPDRQAASRAGLGSFGRNTFIYEPDIGSYVAIIQMVVDCDLGGISEEVSCHCPDNCRICIESCPTGALYEPFHMNPLKCIAFHTYGTGNFPGVPGEIPSLAREEMGSWIYGCDVCQDVCPRNKAKQKKELPNNPALEKIASLMTLPKLLTMDDNFFEKTVQPLLFGYIWDKKFLQRNSAIALGNMGDLSALPYLSEALRNSEPMVRAHAAWALGRMGDSSAVPLLHNLAKDEQSPSAFAEMRRAIEKLRY